eukprot:Lithocolla_globosa_v1_NODE_2538_length_1961_cov_26.993704.p1 type:complete len:548 gc:universal NODE_2538_length_1961_cov_26.993704:207-1850(+)
MLVSLLAVLGSVDAWVCEFDDDYSNIFTIEPEIIWPGDATFTEVKNAQFASFRGTTEAVALTLSPDWIVRPSTEEQISQLLQYISSCKDEQHPYAVAVRSGGHSYSGLSSCQQSTAPGYCFQVDMSLFKQFELLHEDPEDLSSPVEYLVMGPGLLIYDIYGLTVESPVFVPHGSCGGVGIGGHYQTSAYGGVSRAVGLGLDHVASFRIVLPDGTIRTVSSNDADDCIKNNKKGPNSLFWAVLGGNAGSWGIIVEYMLDTSLLQNADFPNSVAVTSVWDYTYDRMYKLLETYILLLKNPKFRNYDDSTPYMNIQPDPSAPTTKFKIVLDILWAARGVERSFSESGRMSELLGPFIAAAGEPDETRINEGPISKILGEDAGPTPPFRYYTTHGISKSGLTTTWLDDIAPLLKEAIENPYLSILFQVLYYGGVMDDNIKGDSWGPNAFPYRGAKHVLDAWVYFPSSEFAPLANDWNNRFESIVNLDHASPLWAVSEASEGNIDLCEDYHRFYQSSSWFRRLQKVKRCVDPENIFRNSITIPLTCKPKKKT